MCVEDHPHGCPLHRHPAHSEHWIITDHGVGRYQDGITSRPQLVRKLPTLRPAYLPPGIAATTHQPISRLCPLERDVGAAKPHEGKKGCVKLLALVLQNAGNNFNPRLPQLGDAATIDVRVWIDLADDDTRDPRREERGNAGGGLLVLMATWLESHDSAGTARVFAATGQGVGLGVRGTETAMPTLSNNAPIAMDYAADHGIWLDVASGRCREIESFAHQMDVKTRWLLAHVSALARP